MASPGRKVVPVSDASQTIDFGHDNGSEVIVFVTANTATVNLPNPSGFQSRIFVQKQSATGTVTVQPPTSVTIDCRRNTKQSKC